MKDMKTIIMETIIKKIKEGPFQMNNGRGRNQLRISREEMQCPLHKWKAYYLNERGQQIKLQKALKRK